MPHGEQAYQHTAKHGDSQYVKEQEKRPYDKIYTDVHGLPSFQKWGTTGRAGVLLGILFGVLPVVTVVLLVVVILVLFGLVILILVFFVFVFVVFVLVILVLVVGIAQAMIGEPDVIILDEPTVGLDPAQIIEIRNLIRKLGRIKTVIISSHILAEISAVCDHVIIISHGNIVANDTLEHLEAEANRHNAIVLKVKGAKDKAKKLIESIKGVSFAECSEEGGIVLATVKFEEGADIREALFNVFSEAKMPILDMHSNESTLEDIFLSLAYGNDERNAVLNDAELYDDDEYEDDEDYEVDDEYLEEPQTSGKKKNKEEEDDYKPLFSSVDDEEDDE